MPSIRIKDAACLPGVSADTLRRWADGATSQPPPMLPDGQRSTVEIQAAPHRFGSLLSRGGADELGLEPGVLAGAAVKATNVSVGIPSQG